MAQVNEIITKFSFAGSVAPLSKYNTSLGKGVGLLAAWTAGIALAGSAVGVFTTRITQSIDPMIQLSRQTGVAIGQIQTLGFVASVTGSDANALQASMAGLSRRIGEAAQGGGEGLEVFSRLGISIRDASGRVKSADEVLGQLRNSMASLSSSEQIAFAEKLGIDRSLVQLLNLTNGQMSELTERARAFGVLTKEQADDAAAYNDSLTTLKFGMSAIQQQIAVGLAPQMKVLSDAFADFLIDNKDLIQNGLTVLFETIGQVAVSVKNLLPVIGLGVAALVALKVAAIGVNAAFQKMLPVVVITGALLLIEDIIVALKGGESALVRWGEAFHALFEDITGFDLKAALVAEFEWIEGKLKYLADLWRDFMATVDRFNPFSDDDARLNIGSSGGSSISNSVSQDVSINISTNDPQAAGNAVRSGLNEQMRDAQLQFGVGGR